ncbi:helix-turn-helix domain-containing protein [Priestia megaterium]|nr:helix-turn-helix domain-containing protein [Priestia megaterium]USL39633.1 helix-turn-helix domain-containing protein [Priestia megaterium]
MDYYAVKLYQEGEMTVKQVAEVTKVSRSALYGKHSEGKK